MLFRSVAAQVRALTRLGDLERDVERWDAAQAAYDRARPLVQQLGDAAAEATLQVGFADIQRARSTATGSIRCSSVCE